MWPLRRAWAAVPSGTSANLYDVIANGSSMYAVGAGGTLLHSTDNGDTWFPLQSGATATLRCIRPSLGNYWYVFVAVGDNGTMIRSTDGGASWCRIPTGTNADLYAVDPVNDTDYYIGGTGGLFLHSTDGGGSCLDPADVPSPVFQAPRLEISDAAPFPARNEALFRLRSRDATSIQVGVFDLLGRHVAGVDRQMLPAGRDQELRLDTHGLPQGMYWVRFQGQGLQTARKILVVR